MRLLIDLSATQENNRSPAAGMSKIDIYGERAKDGSFFLQRFSYGAEMRLRRTPIPTLAAAPVG